MSTENNKFLDGVILSHFEKIEKIDKNSIIIKPGGITSIRKQELTNLTFQTNFLSSGSNSFNVYLRTVRHEFDEKTGVRIEISDRDMKIYENAKSLSFYKKGVSQNPSPENLYKLSLAFSPEVKNEYLQSKAILNKLINTPIKDSLLLAKIYLELGNRLRTNYQYDSAEVYLMKAMRMGNKYQYYVPLQKITRLYINKGNFDLALKYALETTKAAEKTNDTDLLARSYLDRGVIYKSVNKKDPKALEDFETALKIAKPTTNYATLSLIYEAMSNYYANNAEGKDYTKLIKKAMFLMEQAYSANEKCKDYIGMGQQAIRIASLNFDLGNYATADVQYKKAGEVLNLIDSPGNKAEYFYYYGDFLFVSEKDKNKGLAYLDSAAKIWEKAGLKHYQLLAIEGMSLGYEQIGDFKKALELQKQFNDLDVAIRGEKTQEQVQELTVKYETEKKDAQLAEQKVQLVLKDKQRKTNLIYFLSALLVALLAISLLMYRHIRISKKAVLALKVAEEQTLKAKEAESFSHTLSHDLRHPILQVRNTLDLLLRRANLDEETTKQLQKAHATLQQTDSMVKRLLALFMLEEEEPYLSEVDTNELIEEVVEEVKSLGYENTQFDIASLPLIKTDRALLKQIFTNLLSNAVKYSSKEPNPVIKVMAEIKGASQAFIIQDNGIGVSTAFQQKLFMPFMRYNSSGDFESVGLGLVIVKRITEKLHGNVSVKPQHKGFCIEVSLPA
ncbi:MAG: GHKL domain-containing protein [Candidatus Kapabacteria bacterium]|nr:GHKL domain-containing protein [Candidatus Kapabacteria bacterium]